MQPANPHNSQHTTHNLLLLIDPPTDGLTNMAVDEALLTQAAAGELGPVLRFYEWSPATLSLGYFQRYAERVAHPASASCDVVRRASGGGAILHDRELTYSLVLPAGHPLAARPEPLYRAVHQALINVLAEHRLAARFWDDVRPAGGSAGGSPSQEAFACGDAANQQAHSSSLNPRSQSHIPLSTAEPFLCFQRRSPGDLVMRACGETATEPAAWHKILGSAQRRRQGAVLQHGSLLWGRSAFAPELLGISELVGTDFAPRPSPGFIAAWGEKLALALGLEMAPSQQSSGILEAELLRNVKEKFHEPSWLQGR